MTISLAVVAVAALLVFAATGASRPTTSRGRGRDRDRRLRYVERNPQRVNTGDIATLMRAHELPEDEIELVLDTSRRLGVPPLTMWMWIREFGVHTLSTVLAADLRHEVLLSHLAHKTLPNLDELQVFAALNKQQAQRPTTVGKPSYAAATAATHAGMTTTGDLPPIAEPGTWAMVVDAVQAAEQRVAMAAAEADAKEAAAVRARLEADAAQEASRRVAAEAHTVAAPVRRKGQAA
mgnify:CR=1 FL=1